MPTRASGLPVFRSGLLLICGKAMPPVIRAATELNIPILQHQPKVTLKIPRHMAQMARPCLGAANPIGGGGGCHPACIGCGCENGPDPKPPEPPPGAVQLAG